MHGYRRAYRMAGRGPALLLIHGIGDSSSSWAPLIPALAEHYTVLAPDLLGHGDSDKPRADYSVGGFANGMRDLLEILGIERATVVGHSLGGGVAAQFAYQYPRAVRAARAGVAPAASAARSHPVAAPRHRAAGRAGHARAAAPRLARAVGPRRSGAAARCRHTTSAATRDDICG